MATSTSGSEAETALRLADRLERDAAALPTQVRGRLFSALVRAHCAGRQDGDSPFGAERPDGVEVLITAADMLRAAELTSFELAALCNV